ncbi:MAG TPA: GNAT family N-acetyltransferase [Edaphocola sp.]|nr:GNAT family N-acetyltransferase [Edaphocola sp.]
MEKTAYRNNKELWMQMPIFYQPWYLDIYGEDWELLVFEEQKDVYWFFPYFKERKLVVEIVRPPLQTPYFGPYCLSFDTFGPKTMSEDVVQFFLNRLKETEYLYFAPFWNINFEICLSQKFKPIARVTHILDLSLEEEALLANMNTMRRRNIRKAEKELLIRQEIFEIETYFEWMMATYKRQNMEYPYGLNFLKKYIATILKNNAAFTFTIFNQEEQPLAMSVVLKDNASAYYIMGANNPDVKHSAAAAAIMWEGIKAAKKYGCKSFDFEGSSVPEIANFYSKFGARKIEYFGWERTTSLLWQIKKRILK